MKIVLFARTLESTRLCKISQESGLLSSFGSVPKIRNARFGRCRPLGVNQKFLGLFSGLICMDYDSQGPQTAADFQYVPEFVLCCHQGQ